VIVHTMDTQVNRVLSDYYRLPSGILLSAESSSLSGDPGFFRFGPKTICYGRCNRGVAPDLDGSDRFDALEQFHMDGHKISLPFDASEVVENLRRERYERKMMQGRERLVTHEWVRKAYYFGRELLPVSIRRHLQRAYFSDWNSRPFPSWPLDTTVDRFHEGLLRLLMEANGVSRIPFIWFWPQGAPSCLIMTHDVETAAGRDFTDRLMDLDDSYGIKASFQVIPEKRYKVPPEYVDRIRDRGFEFNVHDLNHDGNLYQRREEFLRRATRINEYCRRYGAHGFRAGAMYRITDWYDAFEFSYDMSVPNVAHLEPRRGGCCTVMPYFVGDIVELPLTTIQDYALFHLLNDYSIDLWKIQLDLIRRQNGLMSFIAHPDYLIDDRARKVYESLLDYLQKMIACENIWNPTPGAVDRWWRARSQMRLVQENGHWEIEGPESERARVAYASVEDGQLVFTLQTDATEKIHPTDRLSL